MLDLQEVVCDFALIGFGPLAHADDRLVPFADELDYN